MPIEIKELVIRTVIAQGRAPQGAADAPAALAAPAAEAGGDAGAIVQECVRQVMRILARDKER